jgi:hypothetical protein
MAQFSHADFGGMSQWAPGMTMVGDMFNNSLKSTLDAVCSELAAHIAETPSTAPFGRGEVSYRSMQKPVWWPDDLGSPSAVGAQNDLRYAVFPGARRLASMIMAVLMFTIQGTIAFWGWLRRRVMTRR